MEYANNYHPEQAISPPEVEPQATKKIKVYVQFAGEYEVVLDVPADTDLTSETAVADALSEHSDGPDGNLFFYTLGDFYPGPRRGRDFKDPGFDHGARIWIDSVVEE